MSQSMTKRTDRYIDLATVKPRDFEIIRHVGSGNFSSVFQVKFNKIKTKNEFYAIKRILKSDIKRLHKEYEPVMEKHCLSKLKKEPFLPTEYDARQHIATLHYVFQDEICLYLVMDFYAQRSLWDLTFGLGLLDPILCRYWIGQLINAVEFCHNHGIVHRDLKAENILMNDELKVVLIDFGTAMDLHRPDLNISGNTTRGTQRKTFEHFVGTPQFMSPEAVQNKNSGRLSDLWSLGCTIYQILVGIPPFQASSDFLIHLLSRKVELDIPPDLDPDAESLIRSLIQITPEDRLGSHDIPPHSLASLKVHPYFSDVNFTQLDQLIHTSPPYPALYSMCLMYMSNHWDLFYFKWIEAKWISADLQITYPNDNSSGEDTPCDASQLPWLAHTPPVNLHTYSCQLLTSTLDSVTKTLVLQGIRRVVYLKHREEIISKRSWDSLVQEFLNEKANEGL